MSGESRENASMMIRWFRVARIGMVDAGGSSTRRSFISTVIPLLDRLILLLLYASPSSSSSSSSSSPSPPPAPNLGRLVSSFTSQYYSSRSAYHARRMHTRLRRMPNAKYHTQNRNLMIAEFRA